MNERINDASAAYLLDKKPVKSCHSREGGNPVPVGYKQTEVGVIPQDWIVEPLENFTSFISYGFTNPMPTTTSGPYMVTAKDIANGHIQFSNARTTDEEAFDKLLTAKSKPRKKDLLLTKDGTLGRLAVVGDEKICINQSVAILRPNLRIDATFFKLLLESPFYQGRMLEDAGGSTIKHIYITIVNRMLLGIPHDQAEQTAIANALSDVDALIDSLEALLAKKQAIKTATMQQLLTGRIRLPQFARRPDGTIKGTKHTELGEIPEDWTLSELGNVAFITMGQSPSSSNYNRQGKGLPLIQGNADIENRKTVVRNYTTQLTKKGLKSDVIMTVRAPVGEVAVATFDCCIGRGVCAIRYPNRYLFHWLVKYESEWDKFSKGSTFDSINGDELRKIVIPLPDMEEQLKLADMFDDMDNEIQTLEKRLTKTQQLKQGMMQELLTGKTRLV